MTTEQIGAFALIGVALVLFVIDRWRYDVVALVTLVAGVLTGLVPAADAFKGFAEPVVTTVACVLVISAALRQSGALDEIVRLFGPALERPLWQMATLLGICLSLSAFMNNIGALALVMPVALQVARKSGRAPSELLMPLAFASLLGGLITLIGTPPNLLIADVRRNFTGEAFAMFDFAPVGLSVALAGVVYLCVGWRLVPRDRRGAPPPEEQFAIQDYVTEVHVPEDNKLAGGTVADLEKLAGGDLAVVAILRAGRRRFVPARRTPIMADDRLVVETDPATLKRIIDATGLILHADQELDLEIGTGDEVGIVEAVVTADSEMLGQSPASLELRDRFRVNLLAIRRSGVRVRERLSRIRLAEGDVVVLQGSLDAMPETLAQLGCLPLAGRNLQLGKPRRALATSAILVAAVVANTAGLVPIAIAFLTAVAVIAVFRLISLKALYDAIDWPVIVLLGALMPVTSAVERTGGSQVVAEALAGLAGALPDWGVLALVMIATMAVTPVLNNAATVLLMAPIAANLAKSMGVSIDPFLMAVAIGASCDFLTPIGHQSNTLVMGPGGYRFGDYWRLGLPLTLIVLCIGVPMLLVVWPLR